MIHPTCRVIDPSEPAQVPFLSDVSKIFRFSRFFSRFWPVLTYFDQIFQLAPQSAEDLTCWAGLCLRQLAFSQAHLVFQIDLNNNYQEDSVEPGETLTE